jgi:hypothetical protein
MLSDILQFQYNYRLDLWCVRIQGRFGTHNDKYACVYAAHGCYDYLCLLHVIRNRGHHCCSIRNICLMCRALELQHCLKIKKNVFLNTCF